jgi:hypothetical protein
MGTDFQHGRDGVQDSMKNTEPQMTAPTEPSKQIQFVALSMFVDLRHNGLHLRDTRPTHGLFLLTLWLRRCAYNPKVGGSNPSFATIARSFLFHRGSFAIVQHNTRNRINGSIL